MRNMAISITVLLAACASENELRHTSTLQAETQGVALSEDGLDAFAAMSGTTCQVDTLWGCPTSDTNLPTEDERIVDHFGGRTLGSSAQGVHTIQGEEWLQELDLAVTGVRNAKLTSLGTVVLAGDAAGCSFTSADGSADMPASACGDAVDLDVNRADGTMFAATPEGVFRLGDQGATQLGAPADLVAVDSDTGLVLTADVGGVVLTALDADGQVAWESETAGPIASIATRGDRGEFLVLLAVDGYGSVERRSASSGEVDGTSSIPTIDGELVVSGNGRTVGVITSAEIHWYALELDGEGPVVDATVESCLNGWSRNNSGIVSSD